MTSILANKHVSILRRIFSATILSAAVIYGLALGLASHFDEVAKITSLVEALVPQIQSIFVILILGVVTSGFYVRNFAHTNFNLVGVLLIFACTTLVVLGPLAGYFHLHYMVVCSLFSLLIFCSFDGAISNLKKDNTMNLDVAGKDLGVSANAVNSKFSIKLAEPIMLLFGVIMFYGVCINSPEGSAWADSTIKSLLASILIGVMTVAFYIEFRGDRADAPAADEKSTSREERKRRRRK